MNSYTGVRSCVCLETGAHVWVSLWGGGIRLVMGCRVTNHTCDQGWQELDMYSDRDPPGQHTKSLWPNPVCSSCPIMFDHLPPSPNFQPSRWSVDHYYTLLVHFLSTLEIKIRKSRSWVSSLWEPADCLQFMMMISFICSCETKNRNWVPYVLWRRYVP